MQLIISFLYKSIRAVLILVRLLINHLITWIIFYGNNVNFQHFRTNGIPYVSIARSGRCTIGKTLRINNGMLGNPIGRPQRCTFFVDRGALLIIGENVGMSSTALIAHHQITIGNNVKIGGGTCIYDTDFHAINPNTRALQETDREKKINLPVLIEDNVFIGAHTTILKGVTIGKNSVVGACSVVTKSIPANEIWAGNPARFIKTLGRNDA